MTREVRVKDPDSKKNSIKRKDLKNFFVDTKAIFPDIELRRDLVIYVTYSLSEVVFAGGDGMHIRLHCMYMACQTTFGE